MEYMAAQYLNPRQKCDKGEVEILFDKTTKDTKLEIRNCGSLEYGFITYFMGNLFP